MPNLQSLHKKQAFIDYLNDFIGIVDSVREDIIIKRKKIDMMNHGKERDDLLFWLACVEDSSNSLGATLEQYDKSDIVKAFACLMYHLYFHHGREVIREICV